MILFQYPFVINALLVCLIMTGIHTYLGYHVVKRVVIFVDLSLAQVAALGSCVGVLLGWGEQYPAVNYLISLGFTFLGALLSLRRGKVPQDQDFGFYRGAGVPAGGPIPCRQQ